MGDSCNRIDHWGNCDSDFVAVVFLAASKAIGSDFLNDALGKRS
jgi:hypothetical protein